MNDAKDGEPFDSVEYSRAFFTLFQGAIYLHQVCLAARTMVGALAPIHGTASPSRDDGRSDPPNPSFV